MRALYRFILGFCKFLLISLFVGLLGFVLSVSIVTRQFPPSWAQIEQIGITLQHLASLQKRQQTQMSPEMPSEMALTVKSASNAPRNFESVVDDGSQDIKEILQYRQRQAQLVESLSGEMSFASTPPPPSVVPVSNPSKEAELYERIEKLESVVLQLQNQVHQLNQLFKNNSR